MATQAQDAMAVGHANRSWAMHPDAAPEVSRTKAIPRTLDRIRSFAKAAGRPELGDVVEQRPALPWNKKAWHKLVSEVIGLRPSWHYDKPASDSLIEYLSSGDLSGHGQQWKRLGPSFFGARLDSSWTLRDHPAEPGAFGIAAPSKGAYRNPKSKAPTDQAATRMSNAHTTELHTSANVKPLLSPRQSRGASCTWLSIHLMTVSLTVFTCALQRESSIHAGSTVQLIIEWE